MHICIFGAGGLGGFFGALLADAGERVSFIARGAHLKAMRRDGLRVRTALGDRCISPVTATDDPASIGPADVVLMCVKTYDLDQAAAGCRALMHDTTAVIPVLNGVEAPARLGELLGERHIVPGLTYVPSNVTAPGEITHKGSAASITLGQARKGVTPTLDAFVPACGRAGIDARVTDNAVREMWMKFAAWSASSGTTTLSRQPIGEVRRIPELRELFQNIVDEAAAVSAAAGVPLPEDRTANLIASLDTMPTDARSSTLVDLENGRRLELEAGIGCIVRLGREHGIDTPVCRTIYAALLPYRDGAPG
ncbi:MAG: ketopantoate reductase family protein [Minwuia sp.]|uniref:ketopantoate reductase family protein n=1 Tax=Minwuia sp. TaxID=2493630 RepID=UPI003A88E571